MQQFLVLFTLRLANSIPSPFSWNLQRLLNSRPLHKQPFHPAHRVIVALDFRFVFQKNIYDKQIFQQARFQVSDFEVGFKKSQMFMYRKIMTVLYVGSRQHRHLTQTVLYRQISSISSTHLEMFQDSTNHYQALPNGWPNTAYYANLPGTLFEEPSTAQLSKMAKSVRGTLATPFLVVARNRQYAKHFFWDFQVASNRQKMPEQHIHNKAHNPGGFWTCIHQIKVSSLRLLE